MFDLHYSCSTLFSKSVLELPFKCINLFIHEYKDLTHFWIQNNAQKDQENLELYSCTKGQQTSNNPGLLTGNQAPHFSLCTDF